MTVPVNVLMEIDDPVVDCMFLECGKEAIWQGIISTPCGHPQPLCLAHFERERGRWAPGDSIHCYFCLKLTYNGGKFVRWERIRR